MVVGKKMRWVEKVHLIFLRSFRGFVLIKNKKKKKEDFAEPQM